ncbi:MAG TPA: hypothetical protein VM555_05020, partial [Tahibacter sp.]|nr:hypothetical protein [Tahibacter sp.]
MTIPATLTPGGGSADVPPYVEYDKKLRAAEQLSPLTGEMFGENVSLYTGQTEFRHVDVDLPGNNALPVQLARRFVVTSLVADQAFASNDGGGVGNPYGGLANWDIEVPYIWGVFDAQYGWDIPHTEPDINPVAKPRCSQHFLPKVRTSLGFSIKDVWAGTKVHIPGKGDKELLVLDPAYPPLQAPTDGQTHRWTTSEFDAFTCTPSVSGHSGEGFVMKTPDGTSYTFDVYRERTYAAVTKGSNRNQRKAVFLLASKVTDRYGNEVNYTYNAYGHPTLIGANDGRAISLSYDPTTPGRLKTATVSIDLPKNHLRTWTYAYEKGTLDQIDRLKSVTLPDGLSDWVFHYARQNAPDNYLYVGYTVQPDSTDCVTAIQNGDFVLRMTHPSGSNGEFAFRLQRQHRSNMPPNLCSGGVYGVAPYVDTFKLLSKKIHDTTDTWSSWNYAYTSPSGKTWTATSITHPDGSVVRHTFSSMYGATEPNAPTDAVIEGQLLETTTNKTGEELQKVTNKYFSGPDVINAPFTDQPFPSRYGRGEASDDPSSGSLRPLRWVTTQQQGATFSKVHNSFDQLARPVSVTLSSTLDAAFTRTETTVYTDYRNLWVLGLIDSVTGSTLPSSPIVKNTYDGIGNLTTVEQFSRKLREMTYRADGTLATITDGAGLTHKTTLGLFKRGVPQSVAYPDGTTQSAVINNAGDISSVTDESGATTSYGYDKLSRLVSVTYPLSDSVAWNGTTIAYDRVGDQPGVAGTHWRQTRTTGTATKIIDFDQRLRPVVTSEYDSANKIATQRYTLRTFDFANRELFTSYPSSTFAPTTGVRTTYDALGRVTRLAQDSELGELAVQTQYLNPFKKVVTDARNQVTTTTFQAFGTPSEDAPMSIAAPEGVSVAFTRDVFGKPLSMRRFGMYAGFNSGLTRTYVYDPVDQRLCKTVEPETGASLQDYDAAGNVAWTAKGLALPGLSCDRASVDPLNRTTYTYDVRNRATLVQPPSPAESTENTYWLDGALKKTMSGGATWEYGYNKRGLLESESLSFDRQTFLIGRSYDANGSLRQLMYPNNEIVDYLPNALGQPTQAGTYATGASYWPNGAMKSFAYGNGIAHVLTQNTRQLPESSVDGTISNLVYAYDANANVASITDGLLNGPAGRSMTYDGLNRLTGTSAAGLWGNATYVYDQFDNLRQSTVGLRACTHAYNSTSNRLTSISGTNCPAINYTYDSFGHGNVTQRGSQVLAYDRADRLTEAGNQAYTYDGLGRRTSAFNRLAKAPAPRSYQVYSKDGELLFGADDETGKITNYIYLNGSLVARRESVVNDGPPAPGTPTLAP